MRDKNSKNLIYSLIFLVIFTFIFLYLAYFDVFRLDLWVNMNVQSLWNPNLNNIFVFLTNILIPLFVFSSIIIFFHFIYRKKISKAVLFLLSISVGIFLIQLLKLLFHKSRPLNSMILESNFSFPSSHAAVSLIFFLTILYLFKDDIKNKFNKFLFYFLCILIPLIIGFSRLYLNVHWFSDIMAGFAAAFAYMSLLCIIVTKLKFKNKLRLE